MHFLKKSLQFIPILAAGLIGVTSAVTHDERFIPDAVLRVTEESRKQSCVPEKLILVVNGTSPGPVLRFEEGKTVWIRVYNDIPHQNLTMHWHGLTMGTAPFSDGTPQAAQWPIPPAHFFDYELHVPIGMSGTYFYHSHVGVQALSATGPLIIEDRAKPPYNYDDDLIVFLQDVYPITDHEVEERYLEIPMEYERAHEMVLINGKGGGVTATDQKFCNDRLTVLNVKPGATYRLRLIGGTGISFNILGIEGHDGFEVIETEGAYTERFKTPVMQVTPGQRFSFLFKALENPEKQYYYLQVESRELGAPTRTYAVLNYGPPETEYSVPVYPPTTPPITLPPIDHYWLEYSLRPYHNEKFPDASRNALGFPTADQVTRRVNITTHLDVSNTTGFTYEINGQPWTEHLVHEPYLVSLYKDGGKNWPSMERAIQHDGLDPVTHAFPALMGEVIEIVVQGTGSTGGSTETHPWHAHGAHVWDLGGGEGVYNREENEARWRGSMGHPVRRDTTNLYMYGGKAANGELSSWRAWRLKIDHPGVWMIHCHILPHILWGMNSAWVMGNQTDVLSLIDTPDVEGYLTYGGSVAGNETHPPEVLEFFPINDWEDGSVDDLD